MYSTSPPLQLQHRHRTDRYWTQCPIYRCLTRITASQHHNHWSQSQMHRQMPGRTVDVFTEQFLRNRTEPSTQHVENWSQMKSKTSSKTSSNINSDINSKSSVIKVNLTHTRFISTALGEHHSAQHRTVSAVSGSSATVVIDDYRAAVLRGVSA